MKSQKIDSDRIFKLLLFLVVAYFPIFMQLSYFPIRIWDESRLAINAIEMHENGNFIVTYFKGNPDMWNTKPPLMIWLQVFCIKLFGAGELAIRLPAAIAAFTTCVAIMLFAIKYLKSYWFGLLTVVILLTSEGYVSVHGIRTGDYDSLLVFFLTISSLSFFLFLYEKQQMSIYLYVAVISLSFAVLTKGIAGLLFTPSLFLFCVFENQLLKLLKSKHIYINLMIFIAIVAGYYLWREHINAGYLKAIVKNELGGRYIQANEGHKQEFWFYLKNFKNERLTLWLWFIPIGFIVGLISKDKKLKKLTFFLILLIVLFFLVISFGKTKHRWYDLSLYPFISFIVAISIFWFYKIILNVRIIKKYLFLKIALYLFMITIFINPYYLIINKGRKPKEYFWDREFYNISYYLQNAVNTNKNLNKYSLVYDDYDAHLYFYSKILNDKNQKFKIISKDTIKENEIVIADRRETKDYIEKNFSFEIIEKYKNVVVYKLEKKKLDE